ncbi:MULTISPECIES: hypothetical protein [unclassified Mycobacteroides]|nr:MULTISPECIES: hypothetical protein [unclassified Mycobacteroides]
MSTIGLIMSFDNIAADHPGAAQPRGLVDLDNVGESTTFSAAFQLPSPW